MLYVLRDKPLKTTSSNRPGKMSITALGNLAAAGVASASLTNITDDLLALNTIPQIPKTNLSKNNKLKNYFTDISSSVAVLSDLMLTSCKNWEMCNKMFDVIKSKMNVKKISVSENGGQNSDIIIKGCVQYLFDLQEILELGQNQENQVQFVESSSNDKSVLKQSFLNMLLSAVTPMNAQRWRKYITVTDELHNVFEKLSNEIKETGVDNLDDSVSSTSSAASPTSSGGFSLSGSLTSKSGIKPDSPPIHNVTKQLIGYMEKYLPPGGAVNLVRRSSSGSVTINRNYLLSLYDHVKELAFLVAQSESKSPDSLVFPQNYFRMLCEGPILILGRLMFSKKLQPSRLEKVAAKLSLNLTHIIVHSCCPRIPSKHILPLLPPSVKTGDCVNGKIIYNYGTSNKESLDIHPLVLIQNILSMVITKLKDITKSCSAKEIFDINCAKLYVKENNVDVLFINTRDLQLIDLSKLITKDDKTCFFINLQNLMTIHMYLSFIQHRQQKQVELECLENKSSHINDIDIFSMSGLENLIQRQQFAYQVGQLGCISLLELKTVICGQKYLPPLESSHISLMSAKLKNDDVWNLYVPSVDERLIYLLIDGCVSSPYLQVVNTDTISNQLQITMKEYINQNVTVDVPNKQIQVGQYLMWFKTNQLSRHRSVYSRYKELTDFIFNYVDGTVRDQLQELMNLDVNEEGSIENIDTEGKKELPYKVDVIPFNTEFSIVFGAKCLQSISTIKPAAVTRPKNISRLDSSIDSLLERHESVIENPTYLLTPTTLDYIKNDTLLVSTMVSLVCSDELDEIDQHFTVDYFRQESTPRGRTLSDISLVDIRSYRYQRLTDDFPVLQRHLLNYILPLAWADNPDISSSGDPILKFVTNDIEEKVKLCMFSLHNSLQFQQVVNEYILRFLQNENYLAVINILQSIPETVMAERLEWQNLYDYAINCLALKESTSGDKNSQVTNLLRSFYSTDTQVRCILGICQTLHIDTAIDLLEMCLFMNINKDLKELIQNQLKEMYVYAKIIDGVKTLQFKLSMQSTEYISLDNQDSAKSYHSALEQYTDWKHLVQSSIDSPIDVQAVLMKTGLFSVAKDWAYINHIPQQLILDIEERYIVSLLTSENIVKAFQSLEELRKKDTKTCYSMCENLLQKLSDHRHILFLTSYMLNHLQTHIGDNIHDLQLRHIGAKALQCLPSNLRADYSNLINSPHLILEQLLMNMKTDLAGQIFTMVKKDFMMLKDEKSRLTSDQFNDLLSKYAKLAIEVTVVQTYQERDRSQSSDSAELKKDESDLQKSLMESVRVRRRGFELSVSPRTYGVPSPIVSPIRKLSSHSKLSEMANTSTPNKFIMPSQPPSVGEWVPDASTSVCMVCNIERFSMFSRRHHCRRCGRVVCASCSTKRAMVLGVSARVCDDCYQQIFGPVTNKVKEADVYSNTPGSINSNSPSVPSFSYTSQPDTDILNITIASDSEWRLKSDESYNNVIREEFFYEQAPSVSLSISILNHHSNSRECGSLLLKMCDDLSKYLKPISPGVPNPEVDYSLIISMIKQLLFQAKMKYLTIGDNNGVALCDMYQTRVDLLKLLVESNYRNLPTIEELTKVDIVRRLRDKLIHDERLQLAMEVSTKCGLDPSGVWSAWAMASLYCADYNSAREKFSHCLKPPKDKNQTSPSSRLLQDIIDHLETLPVTGATEIQMLLSSPASIKSLLNMPAASSGDESRMETLQFKECLYYLKTYGTYLEILNLLRRNGYWMKAAEYIVQHKCSSEVFIEGLLVPALKSSDLDKLLDQMVMLDKSLDKWNIYLTSTCRYLLKQRLHHALYQIQIFMKDYIRAAMTCITHFYQQGCQSYLDLNKRIQHLFTSQQHMQSYLDPSKWGSVKHPLNSSSVKKGIDWSGGSSSEHTVRLSLSPDEVNKHIRTIALQIEVTQFLDQCLKKNEGNAATIAASYVVESNKSNLPTLFGSSKTRTELVTMILQSGSSIQTGFDLSVRIIQECRLSPSGIFTHTSRELAKCQNYSSIKELLDLINTNGIGDDEMSDEIIRASLLILADNQEEAKETESLIKLLKKETNKINAYILCGKLRSAYLLAVKSERVEDVQRIAGAAQRTGQAAVKNICTKWLQQRKK